MIKRILIAIAIILTAIFLLFCGASADPAVTAHNTYYESSLETEAIEDTELIETDEPSETKVSETESGPAETITESVSETETETETETATSATAETASPSEDTAAEPEEITDTGEPQPETEEAVTGVPVIEEPETEIILTPDPTIKELPFLTASDDIDPSRPMIALTFDDGPSAHTDRLLDIFRQHGGKGTFFLVGGHIDYRPDTVKRISDEGHEIGGHSIDHPQMTRLSSDNVAYQLTWTREKILDVTGVDSYLVRPPYGAYNDETLRIAADLGIVYVNWSVDTLDWKYRNAETVHDKIMSSVYDGAIVLCHDIHKTTVDAMETVIPELIEKGYQLVSVSDLLSASYDRLTAGTVYNKK